MGEKVSAGEGTISGRDRQRFRDKLGQCLTALARLLDEGRFEGPRNLMGLEMEMNLAGSDGMPRMLNEQVLERVSGMDFQTELGMFNLEVNIPPRRFEGAVLEELSAELDAALAHAHEKAQEVDAGIVMIGILPTLARQHLVSANLSDIDRFALLNEQIVAARGEDFALDIDGVERLSTTSASIAPEAACTSVQLHLQVRPERFADAWNAAQVVAAPQIAVAANAPFLFGRELWRESRPPLFQQSVDTRPPELKAQGVRPRTWFGERWIGSAYDLFEENVRYFPALLPLCAEEDSARLLAEGEVPQLSELVLHNGTVYRWNRPVYGVTDGVPHLRVENRVLPAGPTIADVVANAAFFYGLVRALADEPRPVWTLLPFEAAARNFDAACRYGIDARLVWPRRRRSGTEEVAATELVREELLPLAAAGLDAWGVKPDERDRYLGIIEQRCDRRVNGASWLADTFHRALDAGADREDALAATTRRYSELMHLGEPVHTWPTGVPG
ncbi:glutamate--cysteine ligase [Streptomyces sp. NPDC050560]|uniref:glutamate--cysteine ligase n=1 Tax=Streptomyces sp. NPDC050560 TaxID=3365630 RepID=UPI0037916325